MILAPASFSGVRPALVRTEVIRRPAVVVGPTATLAVSEVPLLLMTILDTVIVDSTVPSSLRNIILLVPVRLIPLTVTLAVAPLEIELGTIDEIIGPVETDTLVSNGAATMFGGDPYRTETRLPLT